jgi:hypothetical protein
MSKFFSKFVQFCAALAIAISASAAHATDVGVSADLGTTGAGLHLSLPVASSLNARIGFGLFSYSKNLSTSSANYDATLKLENFDLLADYFPFANSGFRVTGGAVLNYNKVDATARANSGNVYTFNGNSYTSSQAGTINGRVDYRKVAPYIGLGWGNALSKDSNWGVTADVGLMYQGSPSASLSSSGCTASASVCSSLNSDLQQESAKLASKIDYRYWPVVRVGVYYKFD